MRFVVGAALLSILALAEEETEMSRHCHASIVSVCFSARIPQGNNLYSLWPFIFALSLDLQGLLFPTRWYLLSTGEDPGSCVSTTVSFTALNNNWSKVQFFTGDATPGCKFWDGHFLRSLIQGFGRPHGNFVIHSFMFQMAKRWQIHQKTVLCMIYSVHIKVQAVASSVSAGHLFCTWHSYVGFSGILATLLSEVNEKESFQDLCWQNVAGDWGTTLAHTFGFL